MTPEQWNVLNANINSTRVLLFALAKTSANQEELRVEFLRQREMLETFSINSHLDDAYIDLQRTKMADIEKAVWG